MEQAPSKTFDECVMAYEQSCAESAPEDLIPATLALIDGINRACATGGLVERGVNALAREHWYTRAAAALTSVITDPKTSVTAPQVRAICRRKQSVAYIFSASGYRSMQHLVDRVKQRHQDGSETINSSRAAVLLVFISLDDTPDWLMDLALQQPVDLLLHLMLGWLNQRAVLTRQGENNRSRLLTSGQLIQDAQIAGEDIQAVMNAWMYSSYASEPRKHEIKVWFNLLLKNCMASAGIAAAPVTYQVQNRPKILVVHERFGHKHAMFRCYATLIKTLNEYFETVALADESMIDDAADELFETVIRLPSPRPSIEELVNIVQELKADVIYYPSLGMSHWTVMLAALRLAPIQVMTHGHPATSKLETIDYAYVCQLEGDLTLTNSERVITGPSTATFTAHTDLPAELPPLIPPSDREVRIAVNSKVMKLSWRLLDICKRIAQEATVPVRFSFFPGERQAFMDGLEPAIRAQLPTATIIPYVEYDVFLQEMCKCDLALAAFPFGNTNSTVDTCLLGLPTVVHFGPESPAQTDWLVLQSAGLPKWLVCDNDEDYFKTALRLVDDASLRAKAMAGLDRSTVYRRLINNPARVKSEPFGEIMYQIHRNHQALSSSSQRVFDSREILAASNEAD